LISTSICQVRCTDADRVPQADPPAGPGLSQNTKADWDVRPVDDSGRRSGAQADRYSLGRGRVNCRREDVGSEDQKAPVPLCNWQHAERLVAELLTTHCVSFGMSEEEECDA
jgi:hypothetical protein